MTTIPIEPCAGQVWMTNNVMRSWKVTVESVQNGIVSFENPVNHYRCNWNVNKFKKKFIFLHHPWTPNPFKSE